MKPYRIINTYLDEEISAAVATEKDLSSIQQLLLNTAKWLKIIGSNQWSALLEGKDVHDTAKSIINGNVFVFKKKGTLVGMVILLNNPSAWDKKLWEGENMENSIYLHRLAISREMAGRNLGSKIMKWAEEGIVFNNKKAIRLDCMAGTGALDKFYRDHEYQFKGQVDGFNKYEKTLASGN